ncbi:MAG: hypothetical protein FWD14_00070 [Treponema sp.]|nr:hypothetical protein [Treponema sp.]
MLWPGIKKIGKELNFKQTNSEAAGIVKNCFVKLYDGHNMKIMEIYTPQMDGDDKNAIIKKIESNNIKSYEWPANGIKIIFQEILRPYPVKKIKMIMEEIVNYFNIKYPSQKPQCQHCGQQDATDMYGINNFTLYTCNDCYRQTQRNIKNDNEEQDNKKGNYLMGFTGAILFSIPGILAAILFFIFFQTLAAASAVVYIILGIIGYKKFNGKISPIGAAVVISAGLIMVGLGTTIAYSANILYLLYNELGEIQLDTMLYFLKIPEIQRELGLNLLTAYLVSCIYFIIQLNVMLKDWKSRKSITILKEIK